MCINISCKRNNSFQSLIRNGVVCVFDTFRLEAYDRNFNFGAIPEDATTTWKMKVPDAALYRDITANTPLPLTTADVTTFLDNHEDKLDKKAKQLYEERYGATLLCEIFSPGRGNFSDFRTEKCCLKCCT